MCRGKIKTEVSEMIRIGLQVKIGEDWKWVFCHNNGAIITTENKQKALRGDDLPWWENHFGNNEFRASK
jgi:hypothetical protein